MNTHTIYKANLQPFDPNVYIGNNQFNAAFHLDVSFGDFIEKTYSIDFLPWPRPINFYHYATIT